LSSRILGPFNRVEGDLEVKIDHDGERVTQAWVTSPLYRGFEQMLVGKDPRDALVYAPRICGICSVSQSVAAATALRSAQGITMPRNGELVTNLVLACENVADHLTHFYLFFMPDFANGIYADEPWFETVSKRFKAVSGTAAQQLLPARAQFLHVMGLLAGKWPHSLALQPGGVTRAVEMKDKHRLLTLLFGLRQFMEQHLFGVPLEQMIELSRVEQLHDYASQDESRSSDLCHFLKLSDHLSLDKLGRSTDRFMSYGAYELDGQPLFRRGVWQGEVAALDSDKISEDIAHAWLNGADQPLHPLQGATQPSADAEGYSWCKAPRLDGEVVEVGALARQLIDGQSLVQSLVAESGGNVRNREVARLFEVARLLPIMESWARAIEPGQPFYAEMPLVEEGEGVGMVEAARGGLGHWLSIRNGRIHNYQIIAPTTWNFSPRDRNGQPGPLEQALVGVPIRGGETDPIAVQHIVRSFDPCMVCTVH